MSDHASHARETRRPVVVKCSHGIEGGDRDFVQRYRYDASAGSWKPTDHGAEAYTYVSDDPAAPPILDPVRRSLFDEHNRERGHYNARCKGCPEVVSMREQLAQIALTRLSDLGMNDIPLAALRLAYEQVAREHR